MPFNKDVSDHFYELGLDLLFIGYTRADLSFGLRKQKRMSVMRSVTDYLEL